MAITMADLANANLEDPAERAALYERMRQYTSWFEQRFGGTLCRERTGLNLSRFQDFMKYLFLGGVFTRCMGHIGPSVTYLAESIEAPLREESVPVAVSRGPGRPGYCAREVLEGIREDTGRGDDMYENISPAFDGGIGLSGGLCGALAGALLPLGSIWGLDPRTTGIPGTLAFFVSGHYNLYAGKDKAEMWSVGGKLVSGFRKEFGSLDCRDITGRRFESEKELADYMASSELCGRIKDWSRRRASELIVSYT